MAVKSANLYARIEPDLKEQAEQILSALGIPASNAITMFYQQIVLQGGLPFWKRDYRQSKADGRNPPFRHTKSYAESTTYEVFCRNII